MYNHYQQPTQGKGHYVIKVNGEGTLAVSPDLASINLGVISEGKDLLTAQQQNGQSSTKVINALLSLGLNKTDIQTFDYRIESEYDYEQGKQLFRGYKITNIIQVKIVDLSMIGKIVDNSVQQGVNYVSNVQFKVKDKERYDHQALALALQNAMEKAKVIANTLNVSLSPVPHLIVEGGTTERPFPLHMETIVKGISSTNFEPGQINVTANVLVEYHYRPKY
ncbi:SIMPL domain-containing protein [Bacillus sp. BRMEA1]|uniref:SIMPL domain-containing protein n=1 Tax=Neobacillus endophyticus TaxID=2738405 RepID=UPI001566B7BC|nr:SIMPL domain-containing protein [Neobacillus endophyticus]NRD80718.1 SIMPL domain-containing protein [Neobacillus endophyticus]